MPYVMVPVPEEHVVDVMQHVVKLVNKASREPWDEGAIEEFFNEADEGVRSLLSVVASATLRGEEITQGEAARAMELKLRDLGPIQGPIAQAANDANRQPLIETVQGERTGPAGRVRKVRNMSMDREVAEMIRAAELKALEQEPHPLDRDVG
jgi:hypothetical protein